MTHIRTVLARILALSTCGLSLGVLAFAAIPQVHADPWWMPQSMRQSQYYENRRIVELPAAAASGIATASGVAASGIPEPTTGGGASAVAAP